MTKKTVTTQGGAEALALAALAWIAAREEALGVLLGMSGMTPDDLRARAADPEFLGFVLDFLMQDEAMLCGCAADLGVSPEAAAGARAALPGGGDPHWT